jgi:hypothetical protein
MPLAAKHNMLCYGVVKVSVAGGAVKHFDRIGLPCKYAYITAGSVAFIESLYGLGAHRFKKIPAAPQH